VKDTSHIKPTTPHFPVDVVENSGSTILGEGVFSLWLVMSNVAVDVGLWAANLES
jgi:hypothetical protein